jgi:hypothetical protein
VVLRCLTSTTTGSTMDWRIKSGVIELSGVFLLLEVVAGSIVQHYLVL